MARVARTGYFRGNSPTISLCWGQVPATVFSAEEDKLLMSAEESIQHFSTQTVPQGMRFDYWTSILNRSLWPVTEWSALSQDFGVYVEEGQLGSLTTVFETITPTRARRTRTDVDDTGESCYLLFALSSGELDFSHNGQNARLRPGDLALIGGGEHESYSRVGCKVTILKLPTHWLRVWLPDANVLAGHLISRDSRWGRVLSPMATQLTPEFAVAPPLPHGVLVDQLGATLALIAGETEASAMPDVLAKIQDCIRQRCTEPQLTAGDVATSLQIPPRLLHRVLAANNASFASQLLDARTTIAIQLLTSRSFKGLTNAEISRHAGFLNASYFARVIRKRTGHTPQELRYPTHAALPDR